jgi:hypothetical protein
VGEFVRLEVADGIGTIRLDRPKMNALNQQVQEELREVATAAANADDVRAVIVYGGERVFAAGADIKEMAGMGFTAMSARAVALSGAFDTLARVPKPVVAAINGYALGGGCELALACDWRVAAEDAQLGQPEIALGVIPGAGGTQRLSRLVGPARAKDLVDDGPVRRRRRGGADRPRRQGGARPPTCTTPPGSSCGRSSPGRRRRCVRPNSRSTAAWKWISPPAWPGRASCSRRCSPPTIRPRAWRLRREAETRLHGRYA